MVPWPSAVSPRAGGCLVAKASESSCGTAANPLAPDATFDAFCNAKLPEKVPFMAAPDVQGTADVDERSAAEIAAAMDLRLARIEGMQRAWSEEIIALEDEKRKWKAREAAFEAEKCEWKAREAALVATIAELGGRR